jgi:hypothetical protein
MATWPGWVIVEVLGLYIEAEHLSVVLNKETRNEIFS